MKGTSHYYGRHFGFVMSLRILSILTGKTPNPWGGREQSGQIPMNSITYREEKPPATPFLTELNRCKVDLYQVALNPKTVCNIHDPKYESLLLDTNP